MTKRKIIKQIKAEVKTKIEWLRKDMSLNFGRNIIGDTIIIKRRYFHNGTTKRYMYKKKITMDMYRVESIGKDSLRKFSKASLESVKEEMVFKLIEYIKEWGSKEGMFQ